MCYSNPSKSIIPMDIWVSLYHFVWQGDLACLERHLQINVLSSLLLSLGIIMIIIIISIITTTIIG